MSGPAGSLAGFILARIGEDEAVAEVNVPWHGGPTPTTLYETNEGIAIDARRVMAECEAKRRIVAAHPITTQTGYGHATPDFRCEVCGPGYCITLRALALPYADHPDYREEWAV